MMVIFKSLVEGSQQSEIVTTALDLVKTAATLASDTSAIEPLLHQIQEIVASLPHEGFLTPEEENSIFDIYFKLEHYLIATDPMRNFRKEDLRNKASMSLRTRLESYESRITKN
ncbi:MAG: hypothetical protein JWP06_610 [Candidatus Saccharibacteria bacterium]|nr:hypothetical protein [Candidatus Saccharibacteria bacterium]